MLQERDDLQTAGAVDDVPLDEAGVVQLREKAVDVELPVVGKDIDGDPAWTVLKAPFAVCEAPEAREE
jgi:hypothetical protein